MFRENGNLQNMCAKAKKGWNVRRLHSYRPQRSLAYININYIIDKKQVDKKGEITEPFVNKQCALHISEYVDRCNRVNIKDWTAKKIADYLTKGFEVMSFSNYCRLFTQRMDEEGRETTSQNYSQK